MDFVQNFNDELQSLLDSKPPVSKAKMGLITRAAMKGVKFYKHIVQSVEKFIAKCGPEYKVPGLYVIDSIVRQSRHQFGIERDVYAARFARNLPITFNHLFAGCSSDDKPKIVRVLNLWQKNGVFNSVVIAPLLDMASGSSNLSAESPSVSLNDNPDKRGQTSKYIMHQSFNNSQQFAKNSSSSNVHNRSADVAGSGLHFSKNMLDFDYDDDDEDDGDETPTEAEPPMSSTLNKIEMEQRVRKDKKAPPMRSDQDPVLERWNRLLKEQSILPHENSSQDPLSIEASRPRSRSPPAREIITETPKEKAPTKPISPKVVLSAEKEAEISAEKKAERKRKCLPEIREKHLTICSSTLWLGHVPKTVSEADISDVFGEFGTITSIDLIPPRGCAYVCMDRRQDAKRALSDSKNLKLNGSHIKMAWAPGKGFKEYKKLKDFWEVDIGSSYIPYNKVDETIDFDVLEEGGVIDEDSMSMEMRERRERKAREKEDKSRGITVNQASNPVSLPLPTLPILTQPPPFSMPPPNLGIPPPTSLGQGPGMGCIPFPPPNVVTTSVPNQMPIQNMFERDNSQDNSEFIQSPSSLDLQLSLTERQIATVEQQLSMMQQAQNMNHQHQPQPYPFAAPPPPMYPLFWPPGQN